MLRSDEYTAIKADYDAISCTYFLQELLLPQRDELCRR